MRNQAAASVLGYSAVMNPSRLVFLVFAAALTACPAPIEPLVEPDCQPSATEWASTIRPKIAEHCGSCHGDTPDFGAPFTLLDYDAITAGVEGERIVDEMHIQLAADSMPPVGAARPSVEDRDLIASWASCGATRIMDTAGPTRPPFIAPSEPPVGLTVIDVVADAQVIGSDVLDRYLDLTFTNLTDEEVFIRRFEGVVDESRVLHHLTLRRGDPTNPSSIKYLYAWAPGTNAIEFPSGGVRLRPSDTLILQLHYNNGAGLEGVTDSSGVRLFVGPTEGDEYIMFDPGPGVDGFSVPARSSETVESTCVFVEPVRAIASMPHMHEIGSDFDVLLAPGGENPESILALPAWSFETQIFYDLPIEFAAGDELTVRCGYDNPTGTVVRAGLGTGDEMCFAFTYITPPPAGGIVCRPAASRGATMLEYVPGACIETPIATESIMPTVVALDESPVFDSAGSIPEGHFVATRFVVAAENPGLVGLATFNFAGQLSHSSELTVFDGALHVTAPTEELRDGIQNDMSFAGTLDSVDGPSAMTTSCPAAGIDLPFTFGTVDGAPALRTVAGGDVPFDLWYFFTAE